VPATISFDGLTWTNVAVRHKGESSLANPYLEGATNLPYKISFDKFEDDCPEIKNQRFFGFQELSLANNIHDPSAMRETIVYDLLGQAGLPAMHTAAYELFLDHGDGPQSLGLYTAVEVVDVDSFLEWLGISTFVANWDTYGLAPHNFYLYNDPATGPLNWIPWDHNDTLQSGGIADRLVFDRANISEAWPLIRFLLDDPVYYEHYVQLLAENSAGILATDNLTEMVRRRAALLAPYAAQQMPAAEFDTAVAELLGFIETRSADLQTFLAQP
jgi:spore coat protein CotH